MMESTPTGESESASAAAHDTVPTKSTTSSDVERAAFRALVPHERGQWSVLPRWVRRTKRRETAGARLPARYDPRHHLGKARFRNDLAKVLRCLNVGLSNEAPKDENTLSPKFS